LADVPKYRKVLGETIRTQRKAMGLSQEKLAEMADLHPNYIGEVERSEKTISLDYLVKISGALKMPLSDLVRRI
jgi:transcriptional regulator with XRE-family HTH domain